MKTTAVQVSVAVFMTFFSSCVTKPGLVGNAKPSEEVELIMKHTGTVPPPAPGPQIKSLSILGSALAGEVVLALGKTVVNQAGKALEEYGKQFEASYGASETQDIAGGVPKFDCIFRRTALFGDYAAAEKAAAAYGIAAGEIQQVDGVWRVKTLDYKFEIVPSTAGSSIRFVPKSLVFFAPKANRLKKPLKEAHKLSFVITLREHVRGNDPGTYTAVTAPISIVPGDKDRAGEFKSELSPTWIAAPASGAFTLEVKALETGEGQKRFKGLADMVRKWGGRAVDELGKP